MTQPNNVLNAQKHYDSLIEEAAKKYCQEKNYILPDDTELSLEALTAIDAYIEAAKSILKNQWISVEEGLPTERDEEDEQYSTNVFARTKDCIRYAYYDFYNESWCSVEGGYRFGGDVTHWMPIPSLKGGEK